MMNRENFITFLKHPETINKGSLEVFKDLSLRYPYCSSIQVLFAYGLFLENDLDFNLQLKRAAASVSSRKKLKNLFLEPERKHSDETNSFPVAVHETILQDIPQELLHNPEITPEVLNKPAPEEWPEIQSKIQDEEKTAIKSTRQELLELVHRRLAEIEALRSRNLEPVSRKEEDIHLQASENRIILEESDKNELPQETQQKKPLSKSEILENFIREEPRISTAKASFFRPSEIAAHSSIDEEEIVSETLAKLYSDQGNNVKAIKIYEKLSLVFPEKSRYFADQILKISEK